MRNNNPGNIRHDGKMWRGEVQGEDGSFKSFLTIAWGVRAMLHLINNYRVIYGLDTIGQIIGRWAPQSENDTQAYVRFVCAACGLQASDRVDTLSPGVMIPVVSAMARMECGEELSPAEAEAGWGLFLKYVK